MTNERGKSSEEVIVILRREPGSENTHRETSPLPSLRNFLRNSLSWIKGLFQK